MLHQTTRCLFLGGPADGELFDCRVSYREPVPAREQVLTDVAPEDGVVRLTYLRFDGLADDGWPRPPIYVLEGLDPEEAIRAYLAENARLRDLIRSTP